jgi:hypothetical protein
VNWRSPTHVNIVTKRQVPVYPIKRWNVVQRVIEDKARTNNSQESWHKCFAGDAKIHPTFNKLVDHFRLEQKHTENIYSQILSGD